MKFHNVHGSAISFSEGKITALRSDNDFCNGIVFSDHAIRAGHKFCVELACTQAWSGGLRIGFTLNDPGRLTSADLPKYSVPHLAKRDYYWIRPISESLTGDGYHLMFYIGMDGSVQFFVNNEHKGVLLVGLPADRAFWVMFDIYGNTKGIKLIKPDDTPKEIMAQGPEAIKAYDTACTSGMRPVYSTRLMLVGQDGAGKTSLKKALLGQEPSKSEEGTSGIDLSTSCRFCVGGQGPWTPLTGSQLTSEEDGQTNDTDALEEEYNQALATNIVQELMLQKRRKTSFSQKPKPPSRESIKTTNSTPSSAASSGARKLSGKPASASNVAKFSEIPQELFKEVPEKVVELVQKMLDAPPPNLKSQDSTVSMATRLPEGTPMVLNVWDFGGKEMYYTTHQSEQGEPLSTLEYLDFWLRSVFVHASVSNNKVGDRTTFSPPVFIISEKFSQIEDFVVGKPRIEEVSSQEPYIGERMPIRWIRFHQDISNLFYHNLGVIIYYGSGKSAMDNLLRNTVILSPQWLVNILRPWTKLTLNPTTCLLACQHIVVPIFHTVQEKMMSHFTLTSTAFFQVARFFLDMEHDFVIEMAARKYNRVKVVVMRVSESDTDTDNKEIEGSSPPRPAACAKVRNFLESCLSELRELWMKRLSYSVVMACFCERIVMCGHRRIKTASIRKSFPEPFCVEKNCPSLPTWVKSAAKMLNTGETGKDWNALARELGYQQNQINTFNDDLNPGLALLADWIISSGNTGLSVDMLSIYLEKLDREDVIEIIQKAQEQNQEPAQVFISYQWDSQDEVKALRDRLERSGLTCWMDIGQLGGGDHLYTKIDEALRSCKAVISCVSPKYIVSHHCSRELSLADLLRKPIIPIMMEQTIWPPPGGMALIFSQLVYINMKGVGGHGGTGIHADKKDKYREIIQRISQHATPDLTHSSETESDIQSKKSQFIDGEYVSDYSEHADRYSLGSSGNSMVHIDYQLVPLRAYPTQPTAEQQTAQETQREPAMRPVEQVHVTQCRIYESLSSAETLKTSRDPTRFFIEQTNSHRIKNNQRKLTENNRWLGCLNQIIVDHFNFVSLTFCRGKILLQFCAFYFINLCVENMWIFMNLKKSTVSEINLKMFCMRCFQILITV
ncbi:NEUR-like protein [Mya arenaria]|uniref:NEUR-like protein n=1 Tax=Mya arenaria TaxID=6604 RepID=A0ABY7FSZ9_MYAAR|nr:NEUR-like protein [Mya arenaria]